MSESTNSMVPEIVARLKSGDRRAFEELYELTHNRVYFLALKLVRNHDDALEIVQETYISVYRSIGSLYRPEVFNAWLSKIVVNKCRDYLGKKKDILFAENEDSEGNAEEGAIEDTSGEFIPHEVLDRAETRSMIMALIDALPEAQRTVVLLHYYQGLNVEEIAAIMECPAATVKSRLIYARRQLKAGVEGYETRGVKLYNVAVAPLIIYMLGEFSKQNVLGPAAAGQILSAVHAGVNAAAGAGANAAYGAPKFQLPHKIAALSVHTKVAAGIVAGAVLVTAVATPIAVNSNNRGLAGPGILRQQVVGSKSSTYADTAFAVSIKKTFSVSYSEDKYGVMGIAEYYRPVFSGSSPAVKKLNAFYDSLETQWKEDNAKQASDDIDSFKSNVEKGYDSTDYAEKSPYYDNVKCQVTYNKNGVICIVMDQDIFLIGAAHDNPERTSHTFDIGSGRELSLTDVLNADVTNAAEVVINAFSTLRKSNSVYSDIDIAYVIKTAGSDTKYYLDGKGVWLYYNPNEITYFALGRVEVCIPYNKTDLISSRLTDGAASSN